MYWISAPYRRVMELLIKTAENIKTMLLRRKKKTAILYLKVKYPLPPSFLVHKSCDRGCLLVCPVKQGHLPHTGQKYLSLVQSTRPGCPFPELCHSWEIGVIADGKIAWKQFLLVQLAASVLLAPLRCSTAPQPSAGPLTVCPSRPITPNALALASPNWQIWQRFVHRKYTHNLQKVR